MVFLYFYKFNKNLKICYLYQNTQLNTKSHWVLLKTIHLQIRYAIKSNQSDFVINSCDCSCMMISLCNRSCRLYKLSSLKLHWLDRLYYTLPLRPVYHQQSFQFVCVDVRSIHSYTSNNATILNEIHYQHNSLRNIMTCKWFDRCFRHDNSVRWYFHYFVCHSSNDNRWICIIEVWILSNRI